MKRSGKWFDAYFWASLFLRIDLKWKHLLRLSHLRISKIAFHNGFFNYLQKKWQFCPYGINLFALSRSPLKKSHLGILISFVFLKFPHQSNDRKNCFAIPQHHANNMDRILMFSVVESYLNHLVEFHRENFHYLMKMIKTVNGWYRHQREPP